MSESLYCTKGSRAESGAEGREPPSKHQLMLKLASFKSPKEILVLNAITQYKSPYPRVTLHLWHLFLRTYILPAARALGTGTLTALPRTATRALTERPQHRLNLRHEASGGTAATGLNTLALILRWPRPEASWTRRTARSSKQGRAARWKHGGAAQPASHPRRARRRDSLGRGGRRAANRSSRQTGRQPASALPRAPNEDAAPGGRKEGRRPPRGTARGAARRRASPAARPTRRRPAAHPPCRQLRPPLGPCRRGLPPGPHLTRTGAALPLRPLAALLGGNFPTSRGPPPARPRSAWACAGRRLGPGAAEERCDPRAGAAVPHGRAFLSFPSFRPAWFARFQTVSFGFPEGQTLLLRQARLTAVPRRCWIGPDRGTWGALCLASEALFIRKML